MLILTAAAAAAAGILIIWMLFKTATPPLYGVYQLPGKWYRLKYLVMRCMLWMRERRRQKSDPARVSDSSAGYGIKSKKSAQEMEKPQQLSGDDHALDAVYICGLDKDGSCLVMRIGRKHGRRSELWLSLRLAGVGILQSPIHPATTVYNTDSGHFEADGLRFECVEPHNTWRVMFNGLLRKGICKDWEKLETDYSEMVHVQFSFLWCCSTDVFDFDTDIDHGLMADSLAREPWSSQYWEHLRNKHQTHYEQWGELRGVVKVEGEKDRHLHLRSLRDHSYGSRDWKLFHRYVVHLVQLEDGRNFHLSTISLPSTLSHLQCGYLNQPNMIQHPISWTDFNMAEIGETLNPPDKYSFKFKAGDTLYQTSVSCDDTAVYYMENDWGCVVYERMSTFTVNGVKGYGITEFCYRRPGGDCPLPPQQSVPMLVPPLHIQPSDEKALTLCFDHPACCSSRLVGGKGCQLALLTQMKDKDFIVPPGFCLTITAFETQLQQNQNLLKLIEELSAVSSGRKTGDLQSSCQAVVNSFLSTDICSTVHQHIQSKLEEVFPGYDTQQFAVRSSATGEDSKEMSAAGQMDTILGVKGMSQIVEAVKKCWASHFAHQAVEYRRQYGQPVTSTMSVVIQQMVQAEAAGVLFTCDPVTGNPKFITLNANYGLGESVVSGQSEPDTVVISRTYAGDLSIVQKTIGSKDTRIITTEKGGTEELKVSSQEASECCVSEDVIFRLAAIGIQLEKCFSDARDIEWATAEGNVYLLQARPVTTLNQESEEELLHELDTPVTFDEELFTTANITEVLPGALTPLTLSTLARSLELSFQRLLRETKVDETKHVSSRFVQITANHALLNMHYMGALYEGNSITGDKRMIELSLLGETVSDLSMDSIKSYHGWSSLWRRTTTCIRHWKCMIQAGSKTEAWAKTLETYSIGENQDTALGVYTDIMQHLPDLYDCVHCHVLNSGRSASWSIILLTILAQGKHEWTTEHCSDMAMLLGKCENVYSADVPAALEKLAELLISSGSEEKMKTASPEEALEWLQVGANSQIRHALSQFLSNHGHRCIREMEMREKSWKRDPLKVVNCLQTMMRNGLQKTHRAAEEDADKAVENLKTPVTTFGKFILRKLLPRARRAVGAREFSKSTAVKCCDKFKDACQKLGVLLKHEGYLPDEDLLFYFSIFEIETLITQRSAKLIARAQRRRRLLPKQDLLEFDLLIWGRPEPINTSIESSQIVTSMKLTGMPVSQGVVKGVARVIKSLDQANSIQRGDVLIVHTTDVGWSPYFPLISGLVTELGGLLSHGAVVAREYGLPCVVSVRKAASIFKTGDTVLLNGTEGTLEKIE